MEHERFAPTEFWRSIADCRFACLAALLLRLGLLWRAWTLTGTSVLMQGDTASYLQPGRELLLHGSFANGGLAEIDRTPGYPLFAMLTGMFWGNALLALALQIVLSILSIGLASRIAQKTFASRNAANLTAWLMALEPLALQYSVRMMTETLFVFLLLAMLSLLVSYFERPRYSRLAAAGLLLAASTYVRPAGFWLSFALIVCIAIVHPKQQPSPWKPPLVFALCCLPFLFAWQMRNLAVAGYNGFSAVVEKNLYFYEAADVLARINGISLFEEQSRMGKFDDWLIVHPEQRNWTRLQQLAWQRAEARRIIAAHPAIFLRSYLHGLAVTAFSPGVTEFLQLASPASLAGASFSEQLHHDLSRHSLREEIVSSPASILVPVAFEAFLIAVYALVAISLIRKGRTALDQRDTRILVILLVGCYFLLLAGGGQGVARLRASAMPEFCILAGGAVSRTRNAPPEKMHNAKSDS